MVTLPKSEHRWKMVAFMCLSVVLLIAMSCAPAAAPTTGGQQVTVRLDWLASGQHAPLYLALDKEYYAQNGLAVTILEGQGSGTTVKVVGTGQDTFGYADAGTMMLAIHEGVPVKMIANVIQKNPFGLLLLKEANITKPKDLEGKTIAVNPAGGDATMWPAFVKFTGIDASKIKIVNPEAQAMDRVILDKKVEAIGQYIPTAKIRLETAGAQLSAMAYADYGINRMSSGILVNTATLKDKPDLIRRFMKASIKGWEESIKNPKDTVAVMKKYLLKPPTDEVLLQQHLNVLEYLRSKSTEGKAIGWMAKEDWEATQDLLLTAGQIKEKKPIDSYYTNDFLPK